MSTVTSMAEPGDRLFDDEEESSVLRDYAALFLENWLLMTAIIVTALIIGLYVAWLKPAVYTAHALVQIEQPQTSGPSMPAFEASPVSGFASSRSSAQIQILKSRSVASDAVSSLAMTTVAQPNYLGDLGRAWARGRSAGKPADVPLAFGSLDNYAWGGEIIRLDRLSVPAALIGYRFQLVARDEGKYALQTPDGDRILEGRVGEAAEGQLQGKPVSLFVSTLVARPGTRFTVFRRSTPHAVGVLSSALSVQEAGNSTGILDLSYSADSAQAAEQRLKAITQAYLKQNVERQSKHAKNSLKFLRGQLPQQKKQVDEAQAQLQAYQSEQGSVDLTANAQALLQQTSALEQRLSEVKLQESQLLQEYTRQSPQFKSVASKERQLREQQGAIQKKLAQLPKRQSQFLELSRDAKVANELYVQMLNRVQELDVAKAGVTGFVRIVDSAYAPDSPSGPNRTVTAVLALLLGAALACGVVLLRRGLKRTLGDPELIGRKLGVPVYATIPVSRIEQRLATRRKRGGTDGKVSLLAHEKPNDIAIESLRSLRTSLQFAVLEGSNNILAISSATPGCGKSFVASNLAYILADAGQRVLLVDADLRLGGLHKSFAVSADVGLSSIISGHASSEQAIVPVCEGKFDFLPAGVFPPNPSELLLHERFHAFLKRARERYDMVVVDTAPMLNVTDGIIVAKESGTNFLVARGEHSTIHEIESALERLQQNGIRLTGTVFNGLRLGPSRYGYGDYRYYGYEYKASRS